MAVHKKSRSVESFQVWGMLDFFPKGLDFIEEIVDIGDDIYVCPSVAVKPNIDFMTVFQNVTPPLDCLRSCEVHIGTIFDQN